MPCTHHWSTPRLHAHTWWSECVCGAMAEIVMGRGLWLWTTSGCAFTLDHRNLWLWKSR